MYAMKLSCCKYGLEMVTSFMSARYSRSVAEYLLSTSFGIREKNAISRFGLSVSSWYKVHPKSVDEASESIENMPSAIRRCNIGASVTALTKA